MFYSRKRACFWIILHIFDESWRKFAYFCLPLHHFCLNLQSTSQNITKRVCFDLFWPFCLRSSALCVGPILYTLQCFCNIFTMEPPKKSRSTRKKQPSSGRICIKRCLTHDPVPKSGFLSILIKPRILGCGALGGGKPFIAVKSVKRLTALNRPVWRR